MSNQNDIVMLKSRKNNVLLPSIIEGTAISSDKPSKGIETLVDNFEKRRIEKTPADERGCQGTQPLG